MAHPPVVVVDKHDRVIGAEMLDIVWKKGLYHRIVRIMAVDEDGNILLQRRAAHMRLYPNCWDHSAAGHVDDGNSYDEAAEREVAEEIGVTGVALEPVASYPTNGEFEGRILHRFNRLYRVHLKKSTKFHIEEDEVGEVRWFSPAELHDLVHNHPEQCTPDLVQVATEYFGA
jgi:16S rRNA (adenine1518-N6/adenine1519-N6)-dimethyltransferase